MNISLAPFAPENSVWRDGFGSSVPFRVSLFIIHTQADVSFQFFSKLFCRPSYACAQMVSCDVSSFCPEYCVAIDEPSPQVVYGSVAEVDMAFNAISSAANEDMSGRLQKRIFLSKDGKRYITVRRVVYASLARECLLCYPVRTFVVWSALSASIARANVCCVLSREGRDERMVGRRVWRLVKRLPIHTADEEGDSPRPPPSSTFSLFRFCLRKI